MFGIGAVSVSGKHRMSGGHWLAEVVATAGLILVIFALTRSGRGATAPAAVGAYIGAAYFFTSSASFANPAITIGRTLSDTFAGIAPASVPGYVSAQVVGGAVGYLLVRVLYPHITAAQAAQVVLPHPTDLTDLTDLDGSAGPGGRGTPAAVPEPGRPPGRPSPRRSTS